MVKILKITKNMTTEEKAKAYDEALKIARCWLNDPQTIQDCNYTIEDAIQNIFPVLAKNEDEMIRKELINWINGKTTYEWSYEWCENKDRWIAYLEKLKEANKAIEAVERIDKYIDEHVENAHDMKDSHPDKKYCQGIDDTLAGIAGILQDVYSGEKKKESLKDFIDDFPYSCEQKEQKPTDTEWDELQAEFKRINEAFENGKNEVINRPEAFGLQKSVEWSEEDETRLTNIRIMLKEYLIHHYSKDDIDKSVDWLENKIKFLRPQSNQEWSEEDEKMIDTIVSVLGQYIDYKAVSGTGSGYAIPRYSKEIDWLKSLHPQSKQEWSEDDEKTKQSSRSLDVATSIRTSRIETLKNLLSYLKYERKSTQEEINTSFIPCLENMLKDVENTNDYLEWNEEDERRRDGIIQWLREYQKKFNPKYDSLSIESIESLIDWFKSLRPSWKPSDEQLRPLEYAIDYFKKKQNDTTYLESLYNDLKKL